MYATILVHVIASETIVLNTKCRNAYVKNEGNQVDHTIIVSIKTEPNTFFSYNYEF